MTEDNSNTCRFKLKKSSTLKALKIQDLKHKNLLIIKNLVMTGDNSNTDIKNILLEMFKNYNEINFTAIELYKKCA